MNHRNYYNFLRSICQTMNKHYYSLNEYYKRKYGKKVYKLSINGGMTCTNSDGTLGTKGCIFCSECGSG